MIFEKKILIQNQSDLIVCFNEYVLTSSVSVYFLSLLNSMNECMHSAYHQLVEKETECFLKRKLMAGFLDVEGL